jgi:hypothetical protein
MLFILMLPGTVETFDKIILPPTTQGASPEVSELGIGFIPVEVGIGVLHGKIEFFAGVVMSVPVAGVLRYVGAPSPLHVVDVPEALADPAGWMMNKANADNRSSSARCALKDF